MKIMDIISSEFKKDDLQSYQMAGIFFQYCSICASNRNLIIHSKASIRNGKVLLQKRSKGKVGEYIKVEIGIAKLRVMAQDLSNVAQFGARLQLVMFNAPQRVVYLENGTKVHAKLLEAPPMPVKWESYQVK